jgi:hypothetical protein
MSNYMDRYRRKIASQSAAESKIGDVISLSTSRIDLFVDKLNRTIPAIFIANDKEGIDEITIYSYPEDGLEIGDYVKYYNKDHFIYKETNNAKRENSVKTHLAIACNVEFNHNNKSYKAFFKGKLRSVSEDVQNLSEKLGVYLDTLNLLMLPHDGNIKYNDFLLIGNETYKVVDEDILSNSGTAYYVIEKTTTINTNKETITSNEDFVPENVLYSNTTYTIPTESGYILFDSSVEIVSRTSTLVSFKVPRNITSLSVTTKEDGINKTTVFSVRG